VADALGLELDEDAAIVARLEQRFARRGMPMPANNRKQAVVPRGATLVPNEKGTAPGLVIVHDRRLVVLLPGPPRELKPMVERVVRDHLAPFAGAFRLVRRVLRTTGRPESQVDEVVAPIYTRWAAWPTPIQTTILASPGQIELHLAVRAPDQAQAERVLDEATREAAEALGPTLFAIGNRRLEEVVGDLLRRQRLTISTAESCTGGLLASRLTDVAGSSDYVERGVVCYSNRAKTELLGVPDELILEHGAVSEAVAAAMARGIRERAGTDLGVGITGIAGPGGGSAAKPVGTVVIALAWAGGEVVVRSWFPGEREQVKYFSSQAALDMVRRHLMARSAKP
jgi:nicotinamide-nucleotide amidase